MRGCESGRLAEARGRGPFWWGLGRYGCGEWGGGVWVYGWKLWLGNEIGWSDGVFLLFKKLICLFGYALFYFTEL